MKIKYNDRIKIGTILSRVDAEKILSFIDNVPELKVLAYEIKCKLLPSYYYKFLCIGCKKKVEWGFGRKLTPDEIKQEQTKLNICESCQELDRFQ